MTKLLRNPLAPLIVFSTALSIMFVTYLSAGQSVSPLFDMISSTFAAVLLIYWIIADTRQRQAPSCLDFGFFCALFFPISVPWHCFRSRGWRGVFTLLLLLAILVLPHVIGTIVWLVVYGL